MMSATMSVLAILLALVGPASEASLVVKSGTRVLRGGSAQESRATWFPWGLGLDAVLGEAAREGDGGVETSSSPVPDEELVHLPGEASVPDEALPVHRVETRRLPMVRAALVDQHGKRARHSYRNPETASFPSGATPESQVSDRRWGAAEDERPVVRYQSREPVTVAEYDLVDADSEPAANQASITRGQEGITMEDLQRQRSGDVTRLPSRGRPHHLIVHKPRRVKALSHLRRKALTKKNAERVHRQTPQNRMKQQCLKYAEWMKLQNAQNTTFLKIWKYTCKPIVLSGAATNDFVTMCGALGGALVNFTNDTSWAPADVCDAVIQSFVDSGVGATPLVG